jgi:hypothetical protein
VHNWSGDCVVEVWFLFEIMLFMDVFNESLILILHILDLALEILEFKVQSLDLLVTLQTASLVDWLSDCRVG